MKTMLFPLVLAGLLFTAADRAHGYAQVTEIKSQKELKALGATVRTENDKTDAIGVWLEFEEKGKLEGFDSAHLKVTSGDNKVLVATTLSVGNEAPCTRRVFFTIDRSYLPNTTLTLYRRSGDALAFDGYQINLGTILK